MCIRDSSTYNPVYERTLYPRTSTILAMSMFSFGLAVLCEMAWWTSLASAFLPLSIIIAIMALSAVWMGTSDLAAMRSGVMSSESSSVIRTGMIASALAAGYVAVRIVYAIYSAMN